MPERNNEYVYQPPAKFTEELRQRINNAGFSDEFKQQIKSAQKEEGRKMFERLTHRSKYGIAYTKIAVNESNMVDVGECYTGRIIDRLAAYQDSGLSPKEVQELAKAKADGRLVVLPCKVGDNVYFLLQELDGEWYVSSPHRITEIGTRGFWTSAFPLEEPNAMDDFTSWDEFGETVFLTKEEAEKALERSSQDGCGEKNKA